MMYRNWIQLAVILTMDSLLLFAGDIKRIEIQPFGGFTVSGDIPLKSSNNEQFGSIHVGSSANAGVTLGFNLNESDSVEGLWRRQNTTGLLPAEFITPATSLTNSPFNLKIDQIHCNFLHHYAVTNPKVLPYIMAGLGATTYHGSLLDRNNSMTRFSFAFGGGVKYFFTSGFGIRLESRWAPTLLSASDSQFWCSIGGAGTQCVVHLKAVLQNQVDFTGGIVFRF
jgi:hypothetical protein